jgi:hypothetical protein
MPTTDSNIEIARLQREIISALGITQDAAVFTFGHKNDLTKLDLVTINPTHEQSFLFHTLYGTDRVDALSKMLLYIQEHYPHENSMTIQWMKMGDGKLHTSYFRAKNMYEALDKFFYERDMNQYKIFSITLNPVS